jgi:hypothetical protein
VRIVIRFLIIISFLAGTLYYCWLTFAWLLSRTHAKNAIALSYGEHTPGLKKIPVGELDTDESDEVWFNGNLYDVVKRESICDTNYVFVIQDADEQEALDNISDHFRTENLSASSRERQVCLIKNNYRALDQENLIKIARILFTGFFQTCSITSQHLGLPNSALEVHTPPPRN